VWAHAFLYTALLAALAGCSVKVPSPPSDLDPRCVLECQASHIRCLGSSGSGRSGQRHCADQLGGCYSSGCKETAAPGGE